MRRLHFVLAANNSSSQTRITVEYANQMVKRGLQVTVSVSRFDFYDFVLWRLRRQASGKGSRLRLWKHLLSWLVLPAARSFLFPRPWFGTVGHRLDPRITVRRYGFVPSARNMPDADAIIAFQCYLLPHLLRLNPSKGKVIGSIRLDYRAGMSDPDEEVAEWRKHCNSFYRRLSVPLFAVSRQAMESARAMGIPVDTVIQNGVNTEEFQDGGRRGEVHPLRVTLFTHGHPQKGRDYGCAVVSELRRRLAGRDDVQFASAGGDVLPEQRPLFDKNYGYLTGREYVRMFQETDIFIFPSLYEGFPAVPLEAMACGCALASTQVSGVEEYAVHGGNCMTCHPGDVQAMADNVMALMQDTGLRDRLREEGLRAAAFYSWETAAGRLLDFLQARHGEELPARQEVFSP